MHIIIFNFSHLEWPLSGATIKQQAVAEHTANNQTQMSTGDDNRFIWLYQHCLRKGKKKKKWNLLFSHWFFLLVVLSHTEKRRINSSKWNVKFILVNDFALSIHFCVGQQKNEQENYATFESQPIELKLTMDEFCHRAKIERKRKEKKKNKRRNVSLECPLRLTGIVGCQWESRWFTAVQHLKKKNFYHSGDHLHRTTLFVSGRADMKSVAMTISIANVRKNEHKKVSSENSFYRH